jgi:hypothetical protein
MVWNSSWDKDDDSKYDNSYEDDDFDTPNIMKTTISIIEIKAMMN